MMGKNRNGYNFKKVAFENWRNFEKVEVALQGRVFLVGPNASGKSNFLDAFRFLHDIVAVGGGFQEAVRKRGGISSIRCLAARKSSDVSISVQLQKSQDLTDAEAKPHLWEYSVRFSQDKQKRPVIKSEVVKKNEMVLVNRPDRSDEDDAKRLTQTHLEQVNVNQKFREIVDFFESIRYLHIVPQLIREPDRSVGKQDDPFGGDFLEQIARTARNTQQARLRKIKEALQVAVPQLQELELHRDETKGTPHLRGKYEHWRSQGAWQDEKQFSDGTLRLIGLLWAALDGSGPLLLEEPELSLHPGLVRYIPQMFARIQRKTGRQFIISTHSPELLGDKGIGLDEALLLAPKGEGTSVMPASAFDDIAILLESGATLAEAVMPKTRPAKADQLSFFGSE